MTPRRRPAIALLALAALGAVTFVGVIGLPSAALARPQDAPGTAANVDAIDNSIRTADNAGNSRAAIEAFLNSQVTKLQSDVTSAAAARKRITAQVSGTTSASFRDEYIRLLDERIEPVLRHENPFLRLNAAIALEGVARATRNPRLIDLTRQLISDPSPGVSLWGIKSAGALVTESLQQVVGNETLIPAIVAAVKRSPRSGPLAEEAYRAFQLELFGNNRPNDAVINRGAMPVVNATLDLMNTRLAMYGPGVPDDQQPDQIMPLLPATPASPLAENSAMILLSHGPIWTRLDAPTKNNAVATLRDMLVALRDSTVRAADAANAAADDQNERDRRITLRQGLTGLLKTTSQTLEVIGSLESKQPVVNAAQRLAGQPSVIQNAVLIAEVNALITAIETAYPGLRPALKSKFTDGAGGGDDEDPTTEPTADPDAK